MYLRIEKVFGSSFLATHGFLFNYQTAFNATEASVHFTRLPFDVAYNVLSLAVRKLEFLIYDIQIVLWPWAEGQGQIFLACHILLS